MTTLRLPQGALVIGLEGTELSRQDRRRLAHPAVGGVILFDRNYLQPEQARRLHDQVARCGAQRHLDLEIAVDHEGGRVQRWREGMTALPPVALAGQRHDQDPRSGEALAYALGLIAGSECAALGATTVFAPVLDLAGGNSSVIGDRALHAEPAVVVRLGLALARGLRAAGIYPVAKHFPGHGKVAADTHVADAVDGRDLAVLLEEDLRPFAAFAAAKQPVHGVDEPAELGGLMAAHVIYPQVDARPAGYSRIWLQDLLRDQLGFTGLIYSDDLGMQAAGDDPWPERVQRASDAGCDRLLLCNDLRGVDDCLAACEVVGPARRLPRAEQGSAERDVALNEARALLARTLASV